MEREKLSYAEAMNELESIVERVEQNAMDIDDLTERLKRAQELVKFCRERLLKTEEEVKSILSSDDLKTSADANHEPKTGDIPF